MDKDEMINALNNMMSSGQIPENVKDMLNNLTNSNSSSENNEIKSENINKEPSSSSSINPEMLSNMLNMLGQNNDKQNSNSNNNSNSSIDFEMLMKMKTLMDKMNSNKDDPRANLLYSLKPYLKESRKAKVDQYAKLFSMSKVMEMFNFNGGETKK